MFRKLKNEKKVALRLSPRRKTFDQLDGSIREERTSRSRRIIELASILAPFLRNIYINP